MKKWLITKLLKARLHRGKLWREILKGRTNHNQLEEEDGKNLMMTSQ